MKIKAFYIPLYLLLTDLIVSLPQVSKSVDIRLGNFSLLGVIRIALIPVVLFVLLDILPKINKKIISTLFFLLLPVFILVFVFLTQTLFIPLELLKTHLPGCSRYVFWGLTYSSIILLINEQTGRKAIDLVVITFLLIFLAVVVQYPSIVAQNGTSLGSVLSSYGGEEKVKTFGVFGSANEDGNGLMTLFPFVLLYVEKASGIKKVFLRTTVLIVVPIVLLFNGTRTALIISFPLLTFLFYSNISIKRIVLLLPLIIIGIMVNFLIGDVVTSSFSQEAEGGGTFGWRIDNLWIPAVTYTQKHSPIFGFGSRAWEYVMKQPGMYSSWGIGQVASPHNIYVWVYTSWGIIGLFAFLFLIAVLLKESFRLSKIRNVQIAMLGKTSFCSIIGYCMWGSISNSQMDAGWLILYSLAVFIASLKVVARAENKISKSLVLQPSLGSIR